MLVLAPVTPSHCVLLCLVLCGRSYVEVGEGDLIRSVKEKVKISDWANSGCYCFRNGVELENECALLLESGEKQLSQDKVPEYYTSGVIATMLAKGAPFKALKLQRNDFHVLGTPPQVCVDMCATLRHVLAEAHAHELMRAPMRVCLFR